MLVRPVFFCNASTTLTPTYLSDLSPLQSSAPDSVPKQPSFFLPPFSDHSHQAGWLLLLSLSTQLVQVYSKCSVKVKKNARPRHYTPTYAHARAHARTHVRTHTYTHARTHSHTHACAHARTHTHTCARECAHTHTHWSRHTTNRHRGVGGGGEHEIQWGKKMKEHKQDLKTSTNDNFSMILFIQSLTCVFSESLAFEGSVSVTNPENTEQEEVMQKDSSFVFETESGHFRRKWLEF